MYIPTRFLETDRETILNFVEQNSFATLISFDGKKPIATHTPLFIERAENDQINLVGHIARANPQWKTFAASEEILAVFAGAHAYISPRWYTEPEQNVPTWNYKSIHAYGKPQTFEEKDELIEMLRRLIAKYEPNTGYSLETVSPEIVDKLVKGIVGFRIVVSRFEAAFKLSQHRPEYHEGVIGGLIENGDENSLAIARAMQNLRKD
ncbi:MAG: FMN-binding negative transcriptional regulator [Acidobacteriota bacterium]|nr:FMN-binding negative transcriptional regulator [Acidobacteriota bacterium]